jgi:hypothetical protein
MSRFANRYGLYSRPPAHRPAPVRRPSQYPNRRSRRPTRILCRRMSLSKGR